ncbi:MAG: glucosaminidase [Deltaproteobacteria bacterium]|nr:glucosaminidase [Deltaproteobacteria bacterium]
MSKVILKYLRQRALGGKIGLKPVWSRIRSTTGLLPGRLPCLTQSFIFAALVLVVVSWQETGFLPGPQHIAATAPNAANNPANPPAVNRGYAAPVYSLAAQSSQELIHRLKEFKFWNNTQAAVPPILLASFPADLKQIDVELKKKTFVRALLPAVLIARTEVLRERQELLAVINEIGELAGLKFAPGRPGWQAGISTAQVLFINNLCRKYRSEEAVELLTRVNVLPTSLMLAQAAIESSWGSSRFAIQANNLFGMWTWGERGMIPARRAAGKSHKIAIYNSIIDSVRSYLLTINRLGAYSELRDIRNHTMNSGAIAEGLVNYSGRKEYYVLSLKKLMKHNNLVDFDKCRLTSMVKIKRARA